MTPQHRPQPTDMPLCVRLFGEHSGGFYTLVVISLSLTALMAVVAGMYAPNRLPEIVSGLALPAFYLLQGSPDRRLQVAAVAIMGALIWSQFDVPLVVILAVAAVTSVVTMVCEAVAHRELAAMERMTRRERRPNVLRLYAVSACSTSLLVVPGAIAVHSHLLETGWDTQTTGYMVLIGVGLISYFMYRKLTDELPVPVGG